MAGLGRVDALVSSTHGTGCYIYTRSIENRPSIQKFSVAHRTTSDLGPVWFFDFEGIVGTYLMRRSVVDLANLQPLTTRLRDSCR